MENMKIITKKGEEKEYSVLFDYVLKESTDKYVVYTDFEKDEDNVIKCYSSVINSAGKITKVTDEEQIKFIEETLSSLGDSARLKYKI